MKYILLLLVLPVVDQQCKKSNDLVPACIQQRIEQIKKQPRWNPPAEVNEYLYNGKSVFLFSSNCCDQYNELYDSECNYSCAPTGGFSGAGDGKCNDFGAKARHVRLVWKDSR